MDAKRQITVFLGEELTGGALGGGNLETALLEVSGQLVLKTLTKEEQGSPRNGDKTVVIIRAENSTGETIRRGVAGEIHLVLVAKDAAEGEKLAGENPTGIDIVSVTDASSIVGTLKTLIRTAVAKMPQATPETEALGTVA